MRHFFIENSLEHNQAIIRKDITKVKTPIKRINLKGELRITISLCSTLQNYYR